LLETFAAVAEHQPTNEIVATSIIDGQGTALDQKKKGGNEKEAEREKAAY
jgi:hypothetical protein